MFQSIHNIVSSLFSDENYSAFLDLQKVTYLAIFHDLLMLESNCLNKLTNLMISVISVLAFGGSLIYLSVLHEVKLW